MLKHHCEHIDVKMNVPSASHQGGVWERQIRTVRNVLNAMIEPAASQLDDDSLRTLMSEVMAIVNCRPLTVDNLNDPMSVDGQIKSYPTTSRKVYSRRHVPEETLEACPTFGK